MAVALLYVLLLALVSRSESSQFAVIAYLPEWRYEGLDYGNVLKTVTHLVFFSIETSPKGDLMALDRIPNVPQLPCSTDAPGCYFERGQTSSPSEPSKDTYVYWW